MKQRLVRLAGECNGINDCPNISLTDQGQVAVQGTRRDDLSTPAHEAVVEISPELLLEAANALNTG